MAYAVGVVGMALTEWQTLSPDEWTATAEAYNKAEEQHFRTEWERMRMLATISVQPHVKTALHPQSSYPFHGRTDALPIKTAKPLAPPHLLERMRHASGFCACWARLNSSLNIVAIVAEMAVVDGIV